jgi:hypothetical protein
LFEPHRLQLREELADQAGVHEVLQAGWGIVDDDELAELVADALGRDDLESAPHLFDCVNYLVVQREVAAR